MPGVAPRRKRLPANPNRISCKLRYLALALAAACLWSQSSAPVFRAGTKLVEVTVTVLKKGEAVSGLEAADFTVLDDGKPRPVAFFRYDGGPAPSAKAST